MPITYQWRRDGSPIPDTPTGTSTSATYTLVSADEGTTIDCVVTASNNVGSDASVTVVAPRLISNNSLIGNYEWDYAWSFSDAPSVLGDLPAYQGGIDASPTASVSYTVDESTGRLVAADIGTARVGDAVTVTTSAGQRWEADGLDVTNSNQIHVRAILKLPAEDEFAGTMTILNLFQSGDINADRYTLYLNSAGAANTFRVHSGTVGFGSGNGNINQNLDLRNHWVLLDAYISNTEHFLSVNGQEYTGSNTLPAYDVATTSLEAHLFENVSIGDLDALFIGVRYGSFTHTEHRNDYLSTELEVPFAAIQPTISGTLTIGSTLTADLGSWEGDQTTLTQEWKYDSDGTVVGSGTSYIIQSADAGEVINLEVTGENSVAAGSDTTTVTINGIEAVIDATLLNYEWEHAWLGSRNSGTDEDLASVVEGSPDLTLQAGTYVAAQTTSPFTSGDLGGEVDGALGITSGSARWWITDSDFRTGINFTRHYRAIFNVDDFTAASQLFSFGTSSDEGYLSVAVDITTGALRVRNFMGPTNAIEVGFNAGELRLDTGWHLLDVVIGPDDSDTLLKVYINGKEFSKRLTNQVYIPSNGDRFAVAAVDSTSGLRGDILFVGWRTSDYSFADHFSEWFNSGITENIIDEYAWDLAWDFTAAPSTPGTVPAYAGAFDLSLASGTYTVGGSTDGLNAELIGASRVNDALVPGATCTFSATITDIATNYDTGFANGYHFRAIVKKPNPNTNSTSFLTLGNPSSPTFNGLEYIMGASGVDELLIRSATNSQRSDLSYDLTSLNDWLVIDILHETDSTPSPNARRLRAWVNGEENLIETATTTEWTNLTQTSLSMIFNSFEGVLFIGIRAIPEVEIS